MLSIIDEGGRVVRANARVLVLGTGVLLLPVALLEVFTSRAVADAEGGIGAVLPSLSSIAGSDARADGYWLSGVFAFLVSSVLTTLIGALSAHVVLRSRAGEPFSLRSGLAATARRTPALLVAWLIGHSWVIVAVLVAGSARELAIVIALIGGVISLATLYLSPVMVFEELGAWAALKRSFRLARGMAGELAGFAIVTGLLGLWLRGSLALLPQLLESTGLITFGRFGWLAEGVGGQIGLLISTPIVATATALSYLDTRVRREALDLVAVLPETFRGQ
jgi:hypothetical protein